MCQRVNSNGFAPYPGVANVAPTSSDLVYSIGVGSCNTYSIDSGMLQNKNMFSADQCWDACIDEHGADSIHNAEVYRRLLDVPGTLG